LIVKHGAINTMGDTPAASLPAGPPAFRSETMKTIIAIWNGVDYEATLNGDTITSPDGNNWTDSTGLPVESVEFGMSRMLLRGGPRNGEIVA